MNIEHLRKTLKAQWLNYYRENRSWLIRLGVWVNCEGKRRPSASFILATLSTLEPQLLEILPLVVDLSSNPDRIVLALGLNFNPDEELEAIGELDRVAARSLPASKVAALPERQVASPRSEPISPPENVPTASPVTEPIPEPIPESSVSPLSEADQTADQVTVPVRKIVDPPAPMAARNSGQSAPPKSSGVPQPPPDLPSRLPTSVPNNRHRRPPLDTAILSAGQLPNRDTEDLDSSADPDPARL